MLGWQQQGFWAWADGVSTVDNNFIPINEYGLVQIEKGEKEKTCYYLKPFSKLYSDDKNVFINERKFRHTTSNLKFTDWIGKFTAVYGEKSYLSIAAFLTTLFSDFIFARLGNLPLINLFGPKGTGKTEQAKSILSIFGEKQNEINMRKVTPYAASHSLKMFINAFVLFDEYKNNLTHEWIEFMKSIYNRQPRVRGTIQEGVDVIAIPVNSMVFMCGQEMPTADPALLSRCLFLTYYNPQHTEEEKKKYNELKELDDIGKAHFVDNIISYRELIEKNYMTEFYIVEKEVSDLCEKNTDDRIIRNYATVLTTYKLIAQLIGITFSYTEMLRISVDCIREQMSVISSTNELGLFWGIFQNLIDRGLLLYKQNFDKRDVVFEELITIKNGIKREEVIDFGKGTAGKGKNLLYIRWVGLYQVIAEAAKRSGQELLPENSLKFYLTHDNSFEGFKKAHRFGQNTNQALVFDFDRLSEMLGYNLSLAALDRVREKAEKEEAEEGSQVEDVIQTGLPF